MWSQTVGGATSIQSCDAALYEGLRYRLCGDDGVWAIEDTTNCVLLATACPLEGLWPSTDKGDTASISCATGYSGLRTRLCDNFGDWETEDSSACVAIPTECSTEGDWPTTTAGATADIACVSGYEGTRTRECSAQAEWLTEITSGCVAYKSCSRDGVWPAISALSTVSVACPDGYSGTRTRKCLSSGVYGSIDSSACESLLTCLPSGDWPETQVKHTATLDCVDEQGTMSRYCKEDGQWQAVNTDGCTAEPTSCISQGMYPTTLIGSSATLECGENEEGAGLTRPCHEGGVWGNVTEDCTSTAICPEDGVWPSTSWGSEIVLACEEGYTGFQVRVCSESTLWSDVDTSSCSKTHCSTNGEWPQTAVGSTVFLACSNDQDLLQTRHCFSQGLWGDVDDAPCVGDGVPPDDSNQSSSSSSPLEDSGAIIGGAVGGVFVALAVIGSLLVYRKKKKDGESNIHQVYEHQHQHRRGPSVTMQHMKAMRHGDAGHTPVVMDPSLPPYSGSDPVGGPSEYPMRAGPSYDSNMTVGGTASIAPSMHNYDVRSTHTTEVVEGQAYYIPRFQGSRSLRDVRRHRSQMSLGGRSSGGSSHESRGRDSRRGSAVSIGVRSHIQHQQPQQPTYEYQQSELGHVDGAPRSHIQPHQHRRSGSSLSRGSNGRGAQFGSNPALASHDIRFTDVAEDQEDYDGVQTYDQHGYGEDGAQVPRSGSYYEYGDVTHEVEPPLPPNWERYTDPRSGIDYYFNLVTNATQWEFPYTN